MKKTLDVKTAMQNKEEKKQSVTADYGTTEQIDSTLVGVVGKRQTFYNKDPKAYDDLLKIVWVMRKSAADAITDGIRKFVADHQTELDEYYRINGIERD